VADQVQLIERGHRAAGAVYGTILVLAVISALSEYDDSTSLAILGGTFATSAVFWIAHVYADVLSRRAIGDRTPLWPLLGIAARQEWPLIEAALAPALPLLLGVLGLFGTTPAVTLALLVGLADLAAWGYIAGRRMHESRMRSLASAAVAIALGTAMVLLKNLVH
jgi:hypothetical protein